MSHHPSREDDLALLRALVAAPADERREHGINDEERRAFRSMLAVLEGAHPSHTRVTWRALTEKQRAWCEDVATRRGISWSRDNSDVPAGAPVPTPEVLRNLPKFPPGRRIA